MGEPAGRLAFHSGNGGYASIATNRVERMEGMYSTRPFQVQVLKTIRVISDYSELGSVTRLIGVASIGASCFAAGLFVMGRLINY